MQRSFPVVFLSNQLSSFLNNKILDQEIILVSTNQLCLNNYSYISKILVQYSINFLLVFILHMSLSGLLSLVMQLALSKYLSLQYLFLCYFLIFSFFIQYVFTLDKPYISNSITLDFFFLAGILYQINKFYLLVFSPFSALN